MIIFLIFCQAVCTMRRNESISDNVKKATGTGTSVDNNIKPCTNNTKMANVDTFITADVRLFEEKLKILYQHKKLLDAQPCPHNTNGIPFLDVVTLRVCFLDAQFRTALLIEADAAKIYNLIIKEMPSMAVVIKNPIYTNHNVAKLMLNFKQQRFDISSFKKAFIQFRTDYHVYISGERAYINCVRDVQSFIDRKVMHYATNPMSNL